MDINYFTYKVKELPFCVMARIAKVNFEDLSPYCGQ